MNIIEKVQRQKKTKLKQKANIREAFSENKKRLFKTEGKNKIMKILRFHILRRRCSSQRKISIFKKEREVKT